MLTLNVFFYCNRGQREAFYQEICHLGIREYAQTEEGNRQYSYFFSALDPDLLALVEEWDSPEFQQLHLQNEYVAKFQILKKKYCIRTDIHRFIS